MALKMDKIAMKYADGDRTYIAAVCGMYGDRGAMETGRISSTGESAV